MNHNVGMAVSRLWKDKARELMIGGLIDHGSITT